MFSFSDWLRSRAGWKAAEANEPYGPSAGAAIIPMVAETRKPKVCE
jgi:hypothetical protein